MSAPDASPRIPPLLTGARMPAFVVRGVLGILALALCVTCLPGGILQVLSIAVSIAAVVRPGWLMPWALILLLAAVRLAQPFTGLEVGFLALLAAVHGLHVLGALSIVLPVRGWVQLRALRRPALRYLAIEAAVQAFAVAVLMVLAPGGALTATLPVALLVGAAALLAAVLMLVRRTARD